VSIISGGNIYIASHVGLHLISLVSTEVSGYTSAGPNWKLRALPRVCMKPFVAFLVVSLINHSTLHDPTCNIDMPPSPPPPSPPPPDRVYSASRPSPRCRFLIVVDPPVSPSPCRFARASFFLPRKPEGRDSYCAPRTSTKNSYYRVTLLVRPKKSHYLVRG